MNAMKPVRIQRKRTKGWRMPDNTVCVNRGTKWGNPFVVRKSADGGWEVYREGFIREQFPTKRAAQASAAKRYTTILIPKSELEELRGKNLASFCAEDEPCHADVLLELANA